VNIAQDVRDLIGSTPLIKINKLLGPADATVLAKLECFNPGGSIKDRVAEHMIAKAEEQGLLKEGGTIVEPTSGNTGIGLALIAIVKGYKLIITMPETMSMERRKLFNALGAEVILTSGEKGMAGAIKKAEEIVNTTSNSFMPEQFENPANPEAHLLTTAEEIWRDTDGKVDVIVGGVGTGGTISGIGQYLKNKNSKIEVIAVEPASSAVLSNEKPGSHNIQGIGAGFIPGVYNEKVVDKVVKVSDKEAIIASKVLIKKEGLLVGISSGAAMFAALREVKKNIYKNKIIVVILPDAAERYMSTELFE
jgi:cysteine synthase A